MSANPAREFRDERLRQEAMSSLAMQVRTYATGRDAGEACDYIRLRDAGRRVPSQCNGCNGERKTCYLRLAKEQQRFVQ